MDIKGVSEGEHPSPSFLDLFFWLKISTVSMLYKHFRPTGKAVLTMALPDYITPALRAAQSISLPMCEISAEVVPDPEGLFRNGQDGRVAQDGKDAGVTGNGSSAGVPAGRTVTIYGFNGRTPASQVLPMLKGFRTANDQKTPLLPVPLFVLAISYDNTLLIFHLGLIESSPWCQGSQSSWSPNLKPKDS